MSTSKSTVFISGTLNWVKVLDEPVLNYNKDAKEWTFEIEPNEKGIETLDKHGLTDRIKGKGYNIGTKGQHAERTPFIQLKRGELNFEGKPNSFIRVLDINEKEWDREVKIGNGSLGDVKLDIRGYGPGKKSGMYPVAIRVTDHIPYTASVFGAMDGGTTLPSKSPVKDTFREDFGLDDEIPV